jgi:hypothetical protein
VASKKRPLPRTTEEKLRGLVNLKVAGDTGSINAYTQKELAEMFGISVRTIRRFKNQKGYALAPKTLQKIKQPVSKEDASLKRLLAKGTAFRSEIVTIKGKKRRRIVPVKGLGYKLPPSRILQLPVIYPAKAGGSQTIMLDVRGWSAAEKIALVQSAYKSGRFSSWHYRVRTPEGVGYVRASGRRAGRYIDIEDMDAETAKLASLYHMSDPMDLRRSFVNYSHIESVIRSDEDAGRVVVEIYLVEKFKSKGKK